MAVVSRDLSPRGSEREKAALVLEARMFRIIATNGIYRKINYRNVQNYVANAGKVKSFILNRNDISIPCTINSSGSRNR